MNEFLNSVKADLLDRNRRPYLVALCVALVAVIAYAELGGGSSSTPVASSGSSAERSGGIAVSAAPSTANASTETYNGAPAQGPGRDFFKPLPGSEAAAKSSSPTPASSSSAKAASAPSSTSSSSSSTSSPTPSPTPSSSSQKSGGSTPSTPSTPPKPKAPEKTYNVTLLFGVASPPPAISQLTPYDNVKRGLQLPSSQVPLVTFSGWTTNGASATFTLSGEAILHGPATCVPSPAQCTAIQLKPGETEQLEYVAVTGQTTTYELQVVSITPSGTEASASAARGHAAGADVALSQADAVKLEHPRRYRRRS